MNDKPFYHYRKSGNSITSSYRPNLVKQWNNLFDIIDTFIQEKELDERYTEALNNRIALSILGIGMNEIANRSLSSSEKIEKLRDYINSNRFQKAVHSIDVTVMPIIWRALILLSKYKMVTGLYAELSIIRAARRRH